MKLKFILCLFGVAALISSCSDHLYAPALHHSDIAYMPKPVSADTGKSATYISAGVTFDTNINPLDQVTSGQLNLSHANTFDHFNLAYGAFGVLGSYTNGELQPNDPYYFKNKFFGAGGARLSGDYFIKGRHFDFRIIGFEAVYSHEFGDYANFRKAVTNQPNFFTDTRTDLFTLGGTTELIFHTNHTQNKFGFRVFAGGTFGQDNVYKNKNANYTYQTINQGIVTVAYFMQIKHYVAIFEGGNYFQFRLGYQF
ncbi:hypothetical protein ACFFGT_12915 [Mucilaginibacter angelicae]|uniref:Lipoprotein n=1 Tax=Mucilaginibacter angelicae TaxID=869718 RepID=A0ABV6L6M0_9SPHI